LPRKVIETPNHHATHHAANVVGIRLRLFQPTEAVGVPAFVGWNRQRRFRHLPRRPADMNHDSPWPGDTQNRR